MDENEPQLSAIADDNLTQTLTLTLKLPPNQEDYDNNNGDFEFSFIGEEIQSPVSAEKAFLNGQIRPLFPYTAEEFETASFKPPVSKVFVAATDDSSEGEYCEWSTPALTSPEMRKKCNSTGFSKLWRMKDLLVRSNSDGKDTFVFLNGKEAEAATKKKRGVNLGRIMSFSTNAGVEKGKGKGKEKENTESTSTTTVAEVYEELYGKKKGVNKSYLPYRQDLVGFFTNGNGMTRNVHPY